MSVLLSLLRLGLIVLASPLLLLWPWILRILIGIRVVETGIPPGPQPCLNNPPRDLSVLIVSLDGRELLEQCLPALHRELKRIPGGHQILVVDNGSTDDTRDWLAKNWPEVEVVALPRNLGFGMGNNAGLHHVRHPHVLLLNNDMIVEEGFFEPLIAGFLDRGVFAVSAQVFSPPGKPREETGRTRGILRHGRIEYSHDACGEGDDTRPILWAGGGASLYDTEKLRILHGFDKIYSPAYVEDTDLAWRAWKLGWRSILAPGARVLHNHRSTSSRVFSPGSLQGLVRGNQWIFQLRNLTEAHTIRDMLLWMPLQIARDIMTEGVFVTLRAWTRVVRQSWRIRRTRPQDPMDNRISDRALLSMDRRYVWPPQPGEKPHILMITAFVPRFGVHAGGQRMFHLIRLLSPRYRISVLAYAETAEEAMSAEHLRPYCHDVQTILRGQSPGEPNFFYRTPPAIASEYANPAMRREIEIRLASGDYDLVQFEYLQMAYLLPRHCSLPRILTHHEVQHFAWRKHVEESRGMTRIRNWFAWAVNLTFEKRACRRFDRVITMTDRDAIELLAYDPTLSVVVNNTGVDTRTLTPAQETSSNKLCFVGYYRHAPNVEAMLRMAHRILPLVRRSIPDATLSIIGAAPPPEILALDRDPSIEVTGRVDSIADYVHASKIYVVPLSQGVGIRGKVLEAWALGRAVVSTSVGAAGLRYESERHLLIADSDEEFAAAIVRLLQDDRLRQDMQQAALERVVRDYSWDIKAWQHAQIWDEVLQQSGAACAASPWRRFSHTSQSLQDKAS